jgi:hypothetical protein
VKRLDGAERLFQSAAAYLDFVQGSDPSNPDSYNAQEHIIDNIYRWILIVAYSMLSQQNVSR